MKIIKSAILFFAMMMLLTSTAAWAGYRHHHHHHSRVGISIGVPLVFGTGYYGVPSYYPSRPWYPAGAYVSPYAYDSYTSLPSTSGPLNYVERPSQQQAQPAGQDQAGYWYYCSNPQGYYPNVPQCSAGWQRVAPQQR